MDNVKNPLASKTNWVAIITTAIAFLSMPSFTNVIPLRWLPYILAGVGLLNLILRNFFTNQPTTQIAADKAP